jgi:hypothetical protein
LEHVSEVGRVSLPVGDLSVLVFDHLRFKAFFRESRLVDTGDSGSSRAEQGARANDHGCHVSCSEQHEPRQPRSWLILNVGQNLGARSPAKIVSIRRKVEVEWRLYTESQPPVLGVEALDEFVSFQGTRFRERKALRPCSVHEA